MASGYLFGPFGPRTWELKKTSLGWKIGPSHRPALTVDASDLEACVQGDTETVPGFSEEECCD